MNQPLAVVLFVLLLSIFPALPKGYTLGIGSFPGNGGKREAKRLRKTQDQLNTEVKENNFFIIKDSV